MSWNYIFFSSSTLLIDLSKTLSWCAREREREIKCMHSYFPIIAIITKIKIFSVVSQNFQTVIIEFQSFGDTTHILKFHDLNVGNHCWIYPLSQNTSQHHCWKSLFSKVTLQIPFKHTDQDTTSQTALRFLTFVQWIDTAFISGAPVLSALYNTRLLFLTAGVTPDNFFFIPKTMLYSATFSWAFWRFIRCDSSVSAFQESPLL